MTWDETEDMQHFVLVKTNGVTTAFGAFGRDEAHKFALSRDLHKEGEVMVCVQIRKLESFDHLMRHRTN